MSPMTSVVLESVHPVYSISCSDAISAFTKKKALHVDPAKSMGETEKLADCFSKSIEKLQSTPCAEIQEQYADCLASKTRVKCYALATSLEECSAKHIRKLD